MLLLPLLLLWIRAPMAFSLPWRWTLLGLLGWGMLQVPSPSEAAGQEQTPWLVRPTAAPQAHGASPPPIAQPALSEDGPPPAVPNPTDRFNPAQRTAPATTPAAASDAAPPAGQTLAGSTSVTASPGREREGTPLRARAGRFVEAGQRWTFVSDAGGKTYRLLENLALDRVVTAIRQDAGDDRWSIDATVTEFGGENYLLLNRVQRATAAPAAGAPIQIDGMSSTTGSTP